MKDIEVRNKTKFSSFSDKLAKEYGEYGTPERDAFQAKVLAWYNEEILGDRGDKVSRLHPQSSR
ncbi:hypothetical protein [uncultured Parabacteroides sp.]|jgi:HTH-type transcriptional regulator/antitoxin HipB|uniref:hypothetical protein n=1 Tax=uncultured Parabacteroides sp. TaxID=512312 RepID=UPI0025EB86A2|nr:hypothetical protein [uncultured Parabacteroides sp.]